MKPIMADVLLRGLFGHRDSHIWKEIMQRQEDAILMPRSEQDSLRELCNKSFFFDLEETNCTETFILECTFGQYISLIF